MNPPGYQIGFCIEYFAAPDRSFWKWADDGKVIEWRDGKTLCYREDMVDILTDIQSEGFLPLGTTLLMLEACRSQRPVLSERLEHLYRTVSAFEQDNHPISQETLQFSLEKAIQFLGQLADLPDSYKKGRSRILLFSSLGELCEDRLAGNVSEHILREFEQGIYDERIFFEDQGTNKSDIYTLLRPLHHLQKIFSKRGSLETFLKAGVLEVPEPKELPVPESESKDLLSQLLEDPKLHGIAKLAQRLIASMHFPKQLRSSSDQSFGGVSDLTNRGEFDHLLLSELAYDEDTLMARLVNNEVLYYHHEEPPASVIQHRVVLIDTTIKMWGIPRVYAISAALSMTMFNKEGTSIDVFALGGRDISSVDLGSKEGIKSALSLLDPALDCSKSLTGVLSGKDISLEKDLSQTEFILLTGDHSWVSAHSSSLNELKQALDYVMLLGRDGGLQLFRYAQGHRKLINSARIELSENLFASPYVSKKATVSPQKPVSDLAFYQQDRQPLYMPTVSIRIKGNRVVEVQPSERTKGYVGITTTHRLLYWPSSDLGAIEIADKIPEGIFFWGFFERQIKEYALTALNIALLVYEESSQQFYTYEFQIGKQQVIAHMPKLKLERKYISGITFSRETACFYMHSTVGGMKEISPRYGTAETVAPDQEHFQRLSKENLFPLNNRRNPRKPNVSQAKKFINNGYSTLLNARQVNISTDGRLFIREFELVYQKADRNIYLRPPSPGQDRPRFVPKTGNNRWADGSQAVVDHRGLLHLISSQEDSPQVCLVLVIDTPTAAWTEDGAICGNTYFAGKRIKPRISNKSFFEHYIQGFAQTVLRHTQS